MRMTLPGQGGNKIVTVDVEMVVGKIVGNRNHIVSQCFKENERHSSRACSTESRMIQHSPMRSIDRYLLNLQTQKNEDEWEARA
jgi:hypothetical protein